MNDSEKGALWFGLAMTFILFVIFVASNGSRMVELEAEVQKIQRDLNQGNEVIDSLTEQVHILNESIFLSTRIQIPETPRVR